MLPGYSPSGATLQNHIHLGVRPYDGSSPLGFGPHGEPPYQFTAQKRVPKYEAYATGLRSWKGNFRVHSVRVANNTKPLVFTDLQYTMKVSASELAILEAMQKQEVYFVDHFHCADNLDHTAYIKHMWFAELDYGENLDPMLNLNIITILLKDQDTVA